MGQYVSGAHDATNSRLVVLSQVSVIGWVTTTWFGQTPHLPVPNAGIAPRAHDHSIVWDVSDLTESTFS